MYISDKLKMSYFDNGFINESKKSANEFLDVIKNSPILTLEFKVFNNIENKEIDNDWIATRYIDSNIKLFEIFTVDEINAEHKKLSKFVNKKINLDEEKVKLYNSITNLIIESISDTENVNVDQIHESFTHVLNHIKKDKNKAITESSVGIEINDDIIEIAIDKFNEKYDSLNEDDKKLIKNLLNFDYSEKKKLFEEYKQSTIDCFNKLDTEKYNEKISLATNKINEMANDRITIDDNIIKLHELKKGLL